MSWFVLVALIAFSTPEPTDANATRGAADRVPGWPIACSGPLVSVTADAVSGATTTATTNSLANFVLFDNSAHDAGLYLNVSSRSEFGDTLRMLNGGRLERMKFTVFNADPTNTLRRGDLRVRFRDPRVPHAVLGEFVLLNFDFSSPGQPNGLPPLHGLAITVESLGVKNINLPAVVLAGWKLENPVGTPGSPMMLGQAVFDPPVVGNSFNETWELMTNGTFLFYSFGGPNANFHYEIEVSTLSAAAPPAYQNTAGPGVGIGLAPGAFAGDDLAMLTDGVLKQLEFSIFNGSTSETLNAIDIDVTLRNWNADSEMYVAAPGIVLPLRGVTVNVPPGGWRPFITDDLTPQGIVLTRDVLVGLTFSNPVPATINKIGQWSAGPPTIGGTEQRWWGAPPPPSPIPDFYWRIDVFHPLPCLVPGDMNCSGGVDSQDIDAFVSALTAPAEYTARYPDCDILCGDLTGDHMVDNQDIDAFVAALFQGPPLLGDLNCDGLVNSQDIDGFVDALFALPAQYDAYLHSFEPFRPCSVLYADFDRDGLVNSQDIDGFVTALFGG